MARINHLSEPEFKDILRRIHALENAAPMNNGAVGRSGFEVYDGGTINISSGNLIGAGTFSWQGSFSQSGTTTFSGSTTLAGPTGVTGAFTVQGVTKLNGSTTVGGNFEITTGGLFKAGQSIINPDGSAKFGLFDIAANGDLSSKGTLAIDGVATLKSDLNVITGGKINVGQLQIEPANGGQINWNNGGLSSGSFGTLMVADRLELAGTTWLKLSGPAIYFNGLDTVSATTYKPNVYINPTTGRIYLAA